MAAGAIASVAARVAPKAVRRVAFLQRVFSVFFSRGSAEGSRLAVDMGHGRPGATGRDLWSHRARSRGIPGRGGSGAAALLLRKLGDFDVFAPLIDGLGQKGLAFIRRADVHVAAELA